MDASATLVGSTYFLHHLDLRQFSITFRQVRDFGDGTARGAAGIAAARGARPVGVRAGGERRPTR